MKKLIIKIVVLVLVFLLGLLGFGQLTNQTNEDLTKEMEAATLPTLSFESNETPINEIKGYVSKMDPVYMRDTITPIQEDRVLPISINAYDFDLTEISYEIRSLDTKRLVAQTNVTDYDTKGTIISAELQIENILEKGQEYLMTITLSTKDMPIYYYTRIMEDEGHFADDCVKFALQFHENTFDVSKASELATYLEPNALGDNSSLSNVTINSSLKQVQWAELAVEKLTAPVASIKEINSTYTTILLEYIVGTANESGEQEYYNVSEYFRVRYTNSRMYLLNYERTMNQIFRPGKGVVYDNYIQLGIRNQEVEYKSNEKGTIAAFVQEGELWVFNEVTNQLSQVFSFHSGTDPLDIRENNQEHDIRIINVDETGSVNFVVYGYMNAGNHEGEVGICVYHYDAVANTIEEELFIPTDQSYQIMKADLGKLMYENIQGVFFLLFDSTVYRIDLATMELTSYVENVQEGTYAISDSHKFFAWAEGEDGKYKVIHVKNLDTEKVFELNAPEGTYIKPLAFMENDLIYGIAQIDHVLEDLTGTITFPMKTLKIVNVESKQEVKTYEKESYFISSVEVADHIIYLNRLMYNGMAYVETDQDTIMNQENESAATVDLHTAVTQERQTRVQLSLADVVKEADPKLLTPKEVVFENNREVTLNGSKGATYYAYAWGKVLMVTDRLQSAITIANDFTGVVIGNQQEYIWKRARASSQKSINVSVGAEDLGQSSIAQCVSAMLTKEGLSINVHALLEQNNTPKQVLETTMEGVTALDLTGCTLEEILYYINLGNPVFAMKDNTNAVLVTGYDSKKVSIFDPATGNTTSMDMEEATSLFSNAGNVFFGYLK